MPYFTLGLSTAQRLLLHHDAFAGALPQIVCRAHFHFQPVVFSEPCCSIATQLPNHPPTTDGGILYICGVPGTGKTALVKEVLAGVREEARAAGTQFASINCLQLPSPQHVFSRLWEKLIGQHMGPAR